ncbi:MAG: pitrilysin family protein [Patescibacteria group bacterium]|nr:pitrilysin family protein [Patescibacteria group bacterium]
MQTNFNLKNGLKTIALPIEGTNTVTTLVIFSTGSKHESRETSGISHFLEHMFFKGTEKRPDTMAISGTLDKIGAEFNAYTSKEFTGYWVKSASEHLKLSFDVLSDMLSNSKFSTEEIDREKGVIIEEFNMYLDNPMWHIEDVFEELLYGDTSAGWSTIGTKENIAAFTREDFVKYFHHQYGANSATVVVAGKIPANFEELAEKYFGAFKADDYQTKLIVEENQSEPALKINFKETDQTHLSLGVRTFAYGHSDEFILKSLAIILGGTMSSRLFINLRERNGLAYYVRTGSEIYTDCGYLTTRAGVPVNKVEEAIKIILAEYKKMTTELVSDEEVDKIKSYLHGKIPLSLESTDEIAEWYASQETVLRQMANKPRGVITPEEFLAAIDKVTKEDILRVAQTIFKPENLNLAIIGPYKNEEDFKKLLVL